MGFENFTAEQLNALNDEYLPRRTVGNAKAEVYLNAATERSADFRDRQDGVLDVAYGDTALQTVDIFPAASPGSPVLIFIHGGYWRSLDKDVYSEIAEPFVAAGATVVLPNYDLCPTVTVPEIVDQIRTCLKWVHYNIGDYNGDPGNLYLSGHSAGGHLTGMMMATDWQGSYGLPADLLKGAIPLSGLFDIEPHRHTELQETIRLTAETAAANSPQKLNILSTCPVLCAVGGGESEEFHRQSREFAEKCKTHGLACDYMDLGTDNHFDITNRLHDPDDPLVRAILKLMGL
ncbi:MAG: alpha/beta hydrolase [Proteobacteria bacterium]|nr:alpha/beta hydrolase [Pseudomonadota bacterium]